jgi:Flp pilus assembly pilin Flp
MLELIPEVTYGRALLARAVGRIQHARGDRERGASAAEWVLITAITVTIVVAIGGILLAKWRAKANSIPTNTP